jgi:hypothetical protein
MSDADITSSPLVSAVTNQNDDALYAASKPAAEDPKEKTKTTTTMNESELPKLSPSEFKAYNWVAERMDYFVSMERLTCTLFILFLRLVFFSVFSN